MIIVMRPDATEEDLQSVLCEVRKQEVQVDIIRGVECTVIGLVGDTHNVDKEKLGIQNGVERILTVQEPFKKANRKFHPDNSVVCVRNERFGGGTFTVIAGPCSVESREQILAIAESVKRSGAGILRGGAFKPRTSPYAFQGLEKQGLELLRDVRDQTGMPIVTEIVSPKHVELFEMLVDVIQIGARNMQNFDLLKELGKTQKPILLKRGLSNTIEEWLMSAEYILSRGNPNVILCERGIRSFENYTRNTLDLSAIPAIKKLSHLPIIVDPSHATGKSFMVEPLALAAVAAGADGIMIEVHNDPQHALCDGPQSITPAAFDKLMKKVTALRAAIANFD